MESVPAPVEQFTRTYLRSVEGLLVFVTCLDHRERWWDAATMAREVRITESAAHKTLERLARANLLDIRVTGAVRYQFKPGTPDLESQAGMFAAAYRRHPVPIVRLVVPSLPRSLRDFAEAFKIRRDDDR
jgi:hypothetical protein